MIMCISVAGVFFLLFLLYIMRTYNFNLNGLLPGPTGRPVFGNTLDIIGQNIFHIMSNYACTYGDIFSLKIFHKELVCLSSKNAIKQAVAESPGCRILNDRPYSFFGDFVLSGQQSVLQHRQGHCRIHSCMRKGIMKSLHVYGQDGFSELEEMVQHEVDRLIHILHSDKPTSKEINVVRVVQRSLSSLMSSLISGRMAADSEEDCDTIMEYIHATNYFLNQDIHTLLSCFPLLRYCPGLFSGKYQRMMTVRDKIIQRFFVKSKLTNSQEGGVVNILLAQQKKSISEGTEVVFTDERIKCSILELLSTGILSIGSLITSSLLCLLNDPGYQDRVFEQLDGVININGRLSLSDRDKCPLLEALELEIHRYVTIAPLLIPRVPKEDVQFNGYTIPKDALVIGNIWHVHHDENVWHDPWNFRPQRFLDDNGRLLSAKHDVRERLMPFGVGRRQCIGRPLARSVYFLYMASLLGRFKFSGCVGKYKPCYPKHLENFDTTTIPFIQPKPFFCCVEKRHSD